MVSFIGLPTDFPILVCDLATGTDAIIGTAGFGSVLPHTPDIKNGLLFTDRGVSLQLHRIDTTISGSVFMVGHCSIPPYSEAVLHCTVWTAGGRPMPSSGLLEGLGKYRPCRGQNSRGSIQVEGSCPRVEFWPRYSYAGAVFGCRHGGSDICHTVSYGPSVPPFV